MPLLLRVIIFLRVQILSLPLLHRFCSACIELHIHFDWGSGHPCYISDFRVLRSAKLVSRPLGCGNASKQNNTTLPLLNRPITNENITHPFFMLWQKCVTDVIVGDYIYVGDCELETDSHVWHAHCEVVQHPVFFLLLLCAKHHDVSKLCPLLNENNRHLSEMQNVNISTVSKHKCSHLKVCKCQSLSLCLQIWVCKVLPWVCFF